MNVHEKETWMIARFWTRFWAYLIDLIIVSSVSSLAIFFLARLLAPEEGLLASGMIARLVPSTIGFLGIIGIAYFSLMTYFFGQTLGKMIQGIRVIRTDGKKLDMLTVLIREVAGRTVSQLNGFHLGYIWAGFHPKGFAWHDLLSDTLVVWEKEAEDSQWHTVERSEEDKKSEEYVEAEQTDKE